MIPTHESGTLEGVDKGQAMSDDCDFAATHFHPS